MRRVPITASERAGRSVGWLEICRKIVRPALDSAVRWAENYSSGSMGSASGGKAAGSMREAMLSLALSRQSSASFLRHPLRTAGRHQAGSQPGMVYSPVCYNLRTLCLAVPQVLPWSRKLLGWLQEPATPGLGGFSSSENSRWSDRQPTGQREGSPQANRLGIPVVPARHLGRRRVELWVLPASSGSAREWIRRPPARSPWPTARGWMGLWAMAVRACYFRRGRPVVWPLALCPGTSGWL